MPTINKPGRSSRTRQREADDMNRAERRKIYNTALWGRLRRACLMANPLCQVCEATGRTVLAIDVHHLRSFAKLEGMAKREAAFDASNLVSLCKVCHQAVHHGHLKGSSTLGEMIERQRLHLYGKKQ